MLTSEEHAALPDVLKSEYQAAEAGGYELALDGEIPTVVAVNAKLKEFRANNSSLLKERDSLKADLSAAKKAGAKAGEGKKTFETRLAAMEQRLQEADQAREAAEARVQEAEFSRMAREKATKAGVQSGALDDALLHLRTRRGMKLDGGEIVAEDGTTLDDALGSMRKEQAYFFAESGGAGTPPGGRRPATPTKVASDPLGKDLDAVIAGEAKWDPHGGDE